MNVKIYVEKGCEAPAYKHDGDAGMDVRAKITTALRVGETAMIHTGIYMELPIGIECQVRPRSGLALKYGVTVLNSPGTIDSNYRGECNVILINHSDEDLVIEKGDRIAQFVFAEHLTADFIHVDTIEELSDTNRGATGFGDSGIK